ncbi:MAG: 2-succinyl-5-enolpyruvyl-6-hydroxy-3-cyclohexene-1-carboxylic-acid synthase [Nocardiaceae bacterium]|nr:2-succinyl-5-enolpyruvyl-6-hydroxy-3-cyclohexene-1-carboxylic-acid synthase [Microbacteriaceae bacterium]MCL2532534.1 2-succinyl-5-enolpyruvyl-6-hydroxy-3-cyclohexene-1-carboxylic-acid synthase [Nocardiaceae bacterium]
MTSLPRTDNPATDFSIELLTALVAQGVRHIVVCPGSRSQALALVAAELERVGAIELHVRIDERVAGFLALGFALESRAPAVVVTTSGTAIANLYPAVMEAHEARVPMIVVTADRPSELRGIRSNQTTTQAGAYAAMTAWSRDVHAGDEDAAALAAALWGAAAHGPAHLNLALRDPLSAVVPDLAAWFARSSESAGSESSDRAFVTTGPGPVPQSSESAGSGAANRAFVTTEVLGAGPRTVVIAGDKAGPAAEELARAGGWPLIAEASSNARFGPNLVVAYRELLSDPDFGGVVERAIVFGHPTLSREVPALLMRADVEVIVVDDSGAPDFYDPGHDGRRVAGVELEASHDPQSRDARAWVGSWVFTSRRIVEDAARAAAGADQLAPDLGAAESTDPATRAAFARSELAAVREPVTRRMLADALWRFTWPHDRLVLGASRLIRELDASVAGKKITVFANRGLGGIDGTVATGIGVALAANAPAVASGAADPAADPASGPMTPPRPAGTTRILLGDLTLLHDAGALLRTPGERMSPLQVVVGNDRGGAIFAGLEVAASAAPAAFERVQLTPRDADLAALAQAYGWRYVRAATRGELDAALSAVTPEPTLIEVPLA